MNINSYLVSVYPSSKRNDTYDRNARLNSEQNLISTVNRLTNVDAFVIDGLNIFNDSSEGNYYLTSGSCNIHGYYFTISGEENGSVVLNSQKAINITNLTQDEGAVIYFEIRTKQVDALSNKVKISFTELEGTDELVGGKPQYKGLDIISTKDLSKYTELMYGEEVEDGVRRYFLPIAERKNGEWIPATNRTLKYKAEDIKVNFVGESKAPIVGNTMATSYALETDLAHWLQANYIIDDGSLD